MKQILPTLPLFVFAGIPFAQQKSFVPGGLPRGCHLQFDGVDDRVEIPYSPALPDTQYTLTAWIKSVSTGTPPYRGIVSRGEDDMTDVLPWCLGLDRSGRLYLQIEALPGCGHLYTGSTILDNSGWHLVAASRDNAGTVRLYVDGRIDAVYTGTCTTGGGTKTLTIGCSYQNNGFSPAPASLFFKGRIDEVTIWSRPLSQQELLSMYRGLYCVSPLGLVAYWRMEGGGQVVRDSVSMLHGTLGTTTMTESSDPSRRCNCN